MMFRAILGWIRRFFEDLGWYFRPTVWVQPNMRAIFIVYLERTRALRHLNEWDSAYISAYMDVIWRELTDHEVEILDSGQLPYPTVEEAMAALPARGGTILFGQGVLYMNEPVRFPNKNIRLIGGNFCSAGTCLEISGSSRVEIIGCCFDNINVGPRDWSPRGEFPRDISGGAAIQFNVEP